MGFLKYFFKFLVKNYIRVCLYTGKCTYPKLNEFFQSEHTYVPRIKKQNIINTQEPHHTAFQSLPILIVSSIDQFCLSLNSIYNHNVCTFLSYFFTQLYICEILPFHCIQLQIIPFIPFCEYITICEFILLLDIGVVSNLELLEMALTTNIPVHVFR